MSGGQSRALLELTLLTGQPDAVLLTQVDVKVRPPEEFLLAQLTPQYAGLRLLVEVVLRLREGSGAGSGTALALKVRLEDVGAGDDGVAGHHRGGAAVALHLLPLLGRQLGCEGRRDGEDPGGSTRDHDLLVGPLAWGWRGFAGVAAWRRPHDALQLLLGEIVLQVFLTVGLVHVDLQVVVTGESLVTHWTPDT